MILKSSFLKEKKRILKGMKGEGIFLKRKHLIQTHFPLLSL